jgi:hypothetical protein
MRERVATSLASLPSTRSEVAHTRRGVEAAEIYGLDAKPVGTRIRSPNPEDCPNHNFDALVSNLVFLLPLDYSPYQHNI